MSPTPILLHSTCSHLTLSLSSLHVRRHITSILYRLTSWVASHWSLISHITLHSSSAHIHRVLGMTLTRMTLIWVSTHWLSSHLRITHLLLLLGSVGSLHVCLLSLLVLSILCLRFLFHLFLSKQSSQFIITGSSCRNIRVSLKNFHGILKGCHHGCEFLSPFSDAWRLSKT